MCCNLLGNKESHPDEQAKSANLWKSVWEDLISWHHSWSLEAATPHVNVKDRARKMWWSVAFLHFHLELDSKLFVDVASINYMYLPVYLCFLNVVCMTPPSVCLHDKNRPRRRRRRRKKKKKRKKNKKCREQQKNREEEQEEKARTNRRKRNRNT